LSDERHTNVYTRGQNPTVEAVEAKLARLERGDAAKCMASGMGAISAVLFGLLEAGSHVLFVNQTYGPTLQLAERLRAYGVEHDLLLDLDLKSIEAAMRPNTRIVWLESPGTMTFRLLDVGAVAALAREMGALTAIDNSWATPLFQKPLERGVDLVVHTASKYIGGHSDVMAGAVVGSAELIERIFYDGYLLLGAALGPVDAWLVNRGLRTLPARMRQHHTTGLAVARFLDEHPAVRRVLHPGLTAAPELVDSQLTGFSGLVSFELATDTYEDVAAVIDRLRLFRIGVSWGGVESVVISPNRGDNAAALTDQGISPGTIRLSLGLEGADALIEDLDRALTSQGRG
jgi:cystathionine beta-lyase/cystathionine gamma-synthase